MNCVYHSWLAHCYYLGINPPSYTFHLFRLLYKLSRNEGGMYGGCVPFTIRILNLTVNIRIKQVQHHQFFDKPAWIAGSESIGQEWMSRISGFGSEGINIKPAIYLVLNDHHAVFSELRPERLVVLAIQLERKEQNVRTGHTVEKPRFAAG